MTQAKKYDGTWVRLELRTDGWYDGDTFVCGVMGCEKLPSGYRLVEINI